MSNHDHSHGHGHNHGHDHGDPKWKHDGVRVIPGNALDSNTAQTPGMDRRAAINEAAVLVVLVEYRLVPLP